MADTTHTYRIQQKLNATDTLTLHPETEASVVSYGQTTVSDELSSLDERAANLETQVSAVESAYIKNAVLSNNNKTLTLTKQDGTTVAITDTNTNTTYTFAEGSTNGAFSVTPSGESAQSVEIHGLGSAAYTESSAYDSAGTAENLSNTAKQAAMDYADDLITGLGTIMKFSGTVANETALKALTGKKKGEVYVVTADHSEWVATADAASATATTTWEKFGTTDVTGALYKGTTFTTGDVVVAEATDGKSKTVAASTLSVGNAAKLGNKTESQLSVSYASSAGAAIEADHAGYAAQLDGTLGISGGGTGATTAAGARTNLGLGNAAVKTVEPTGVAQNTTNLVTAAQVKSFVEGKGYTTNTGTVTSVAAGTGLSGGTITTSGTLSLAASGVTAGSYSAVTVDTYGRVTVGAQIVEVGTTVNAGPSASLATGGIFFKRLT